MKKGNTYRDNFLVDLSRGLRRGPGSSFVAGKGGGGDRRRHAESSVGKAARVEAESAGGGDYSNVSVSPSLCRFLSATRLPEAETRNCS
nr:hypothetical protein Itr_chr09CG18520 [Ipomoea trifida]